MRPEDCEYFERRAETEIEMARRAKHARAVQAHYELANFYLERVHSPDCGEEPNRPAAGR